MANVKQDQKVQAGSAELSKPKLRLRTRLMETLDRIFTTRQEKLVGERGLLAAPMGRRRMLALGAAAVLAACAPLPAVARETTPVKTAAGTSTKNSNEVEYEPFSDPKELEPYFQNAEGKLVKLKDRKEVKIGDYFVTAEKSSGVTFSIQSQDGTYSEWGLAFVSSMDNVNVLVIDMGENHPLVKGKMLVFADSANVYFQFFDKMRNAHSLAGVPLWEGKMKRGPIRTGFGIDESGIFVINAPKDLKRGDVVCQATIRNNGDSGPYWYKYEGPDTQETKTVAMR